MTNRERMLNLLQYKDVDRLPAVHFGYWPELIEEWAAQKKIPAEYVETFNSGWHKDILDDLLGWDFFYENIIFHKNGLWPRFEKKVIEVLPDGTQRVQTSHGNIERIKPGIASIPSEDDYLLKDRASFEKYYKDKMSFKPERLDLARFENFNETRRYDIPVGIKLGSVIGELRNIMTVVGMGYLIYDEDEELFADIVDTYAEMQYQCLEAILKTGAKFDFGHYWEDICFKNGPLISPRIFEEVLLKHYKKRNDLCHQYGIELISLDCDGVIGELIPLWLESGVNVMFPIEVGVWGDQFAPARAKHGRELRGVGGMDKRAFLADKSAIDAEIERLKPLIALGGYVPCPDHLLMPGTKFELVQYYTDRIKNLKI